MEPGSVAMKSNPRHIGSTIAAASPSGQREKVRVAEKLDTLPLIDNAFKSGALSYSKVRAMVRVATPENESFLLQIARYGTASHMEKLVRKYQWVERLNSDNKAETQQEERSFRWYHDDDGMVIFHGKLPAESGAIVVKALQAAFEAVHNRSIGPEKVAERLSKEIPPAEETHPEDEGEEWAVVYESPADESHHSFVDLETATHAEPVLETTPRSRADDSESGPDAGLASPNQKNDSAETFSRIAVGLRILDVNAHVSNRGRRRPLTCCSSMKHVRLHQAHPTFPQ